MNPKTEDVSPNGEYPKCLYPKHSRPVVAQNEVQEAAILKLDADVEAATQAAKEPAPVVQQATPNQNISKKEPKFALAE